MRRPLAWAALAFLAYFAAVVAGSVVQDALDLPLTMGWTMQGVSALVVVALARALGSPAELLAWRRPVTAPGLPTAMVIMCSVAASTLITLSGPAESASTYGVEYFLYQATMPGLGEELGLRGLTLGLLLVHCKGSNRCTWVMLGVQALPFGLLHLTEVETAREALVTFAYTFAVAVGLGWLRVRTGSLWPCVIAHNAINVGGRLLVLALTPGTS